MAGPTTVMQRVCTRELARRVPLRRRIRALARPGAADAASDRAASLWALTLLQDRRQQPGSKEPELPGPLAEVHQEVAGLPGGPVEGAFELRPAEVLERALVVHPQ